MYFPGGVVRDNLFVACPSPWEYPAGNYFPATYDAVGFANLAAGDYHLSSSSAYTRTGTDGRDPGADIDALIAALSGTAVPSRPPAGDAAPVVSLVSPTDGTSYAAPATIRCSADASDSDQTPVARVDFYANGTLACSATAAPFTCSWSGVAAGSYSITATAFDAAGLRATSAASAITVVGASASLPAPWIDQDVGAVGLAGSASYANDRFTVRGAGADVWGTADGFNFVHQALSGDGQVVARLLSLQNTNAYAKAGVMVRASLAADSANVLLDLKPDGGMELLARQSNGGSTRVVSSGAAAMGTWLRLVRSGSKLTASTSIDGSHWTAVGSTSITLGQAAYVGIVVCSHATGLLDTAAFDNVTVTAARAKAQPRKSIFSAVPPRQGRPRVRR
jgi:regulation of enolase protein 1 (concanavalin A-like superfamily)